MDWGNRQFNLDNHRNLTYIITMNEIKISTQAEFDALTTPKDFTNIYIIGELSKIGRAIDNTIIYVYGSAKIGSVYGSAKIDYVSGSAKIGSVYGSAKIDYVYGSAKIGSVYGSAKIDYVSGSAKIDYVYGSAKIDYVSGSAKIGSVYGSAKIDYVYGSAKIGSVYDSAKIDYVSGSAKIGSVYGYGSANIHNDCSPILHGFSVIWAFNELCKPIQKSTNSVILRPNLDPLETYFNSNPIDISGETVLLYKRVSSNLLTQEKTANETLWCIGQEIIHPNWSPSNSECGEGKFHACSRPVFCDSFRSNEGDRYICIEVNKADLFAWKNPSYPRKIAFRKGVVLYECDREGNKI